MNNLKRFEEFSTIQEAALSVDMKANYTQIIQAVHKANKLLELPENKKVDKLFMIEIAMAETKLGTDNGTVRTSGNAGRGAWQLDKVGFEESRDVNSHPQVKVYIDRLKKNGIDWNAIDWNHCNQPLYGALAARLFLLNKPFSIGATVEERAKQWKQHYNSTSGAGSAAEYIERVNTCKQTLGIHDLLPGVAVPKPQSGSGLLNFLNTQGHKTLIKP